MGSGVDHSDALKNVDQIEIWVSAHEISDNVLVLLMELLYQMWLLIKILTCVQSLFLLGPRVVISGSEEAISAATTVEIGVAGS